MRYRPFTQTGMAVSTITLLLNGGDEQKTPADWRDLVHAAFEEGVNAFEIVHPTLHLLTGFAEGIAPVKRSLLFVGLRVDAGIDAGSLERWAEEATSHAKLGELNLLTIDVSDARSEGMLPALQRLRTSQLAHRLAVSGGGDLLDQDIDAGHFDAAVTPFNMLSSWRDRNMVRKALEKHMGVIASDPFPDALNGLIDAAEGVVKPGWFKKPKPLAGAGTYAFLTATRGWSAEQLCLAYALTEPAVASVLVQVQDREHLTELASTTDRDLPPTVSAQIEMARFSADAEAERAGKARRSA